MSALTSPLFRAQKPPAPLVPRGGKIDSFVNISGYTLENYKSSHPEGFTIICETGKYCDVVNVFPNTNTIVLDINSQSRVFSNDFYEKFLPDIAEQLNISLEDAAEKSLAFFNGNTIVVQPTGLQGKVFNFMRQTQNVAPVIYTVEALKIAKLTGMTGLQIITAAPLTFVGATYLTGILCGYFGAIAGDNAVGLIFNTSSYILTRPMWSVETTLNGLVLSPISHVTGLPLMLNGTREVLTGQGLSAQEYVKMGIAMQRLSKVIEKLKKVYNAAIEALKSNP
jgi:hypothetical protein